MPHIPELYPAIPGLNQPNGIQIDAHELDIALSLQREFDRRKDERDSNPRHPGWDLPPARNLLFLHPRR